MSTHPARHVVLGSGPAGSTLTDVLLDRGHTVRQVDRHGTGPAAEGLERVAADATDTDDMIRVTTGADVVYHCVNAPYHLQTEVMPRVTTAVLDALAVNPARLVVLDTLYPYGEADSEAITEATPWAATTSKGLLRAELDRRYLAAHEAGTHRIVAGRAADFYGPGVLNSALGGGVFPGALGGGEVFSFGDTSLPHSYTFIGDVAAGLAALGADDSGDGRIWHLPTAPAVNTDRVLAIISELVGGPLEVRNLQRAEPTGPFDATFMAGYEEMFYQYRIPQNMVSTAFERAFGVTPTPLHDGLRATVEWYRAFLSA